MALSERGASNVALLLPHLPPFLLRETTPIPSPDDPIDLATAENLSLRAELLDFCKETLQSHTISEHLNYPNGLAGDPDLVHAQAAFFNRHFAPHAPVLPRHVANAPGAAQALDAILYNICDAGDGALVPAPFWPGYNVFFHFRSQVAILAVATSPPTDILTEALVPALERAIASAPTPPKALVITNPHNPLGRCYSRAVLAALFRLCSRHGMHLVSDEVFALSVWESPDYEDLDGEGFVSVLSLDAEALGCSGRVHAVWGVSKDFGMSGVRVGCTVTQANPDLRNAIALAAHDATSNAAALVATQLLTSPRLPALIALNRTRLAASYTMLTAALRRLGVPYVPCNAALFVFARLAPHATTWEAEAAAVETLRAGGVLVGAGRGFRGHEDEKGWVRLLFSVERGELERAVGRLERVLGGSGGEEEEEEEGGGGMGGGGDLG